jgi:chemotaxis protein CheY-P-specific phosphatase CheC
MAEEIAQEPTLEDIENLFAELFNQMSSASKKLTQLGKRIREETAALPPMPDIDALEREYQTLPVSTRPSWFEFIASHSEAYNKQSHNARFEFVASQSLPEAKKFAHQ